MGNTSLLPVTALHWISSATRMTRTLFSRRAACPQTAITGLTYTPAIPSWTGALPASSSSWAANALFNGYKGLFLNPDYSGSDEKYLSGTEFKEIYALYLFDRELRNIFIRYILEIENNVKSVLAHDFSQKYGYNNYLKITNFEFSVQPGERKTHAQKIGDISDLIASLQKEIAI